MADLVNQIDSYNQSSFDDDSSEDLISEVSINNGGENNVSSPDSPSKLPLVTNLYTKESLSKDEIKKEDEGLLTVKQHNTASDDLADILDSFPNESRNTNNSIVEVPDSMPRLNSDSITFNVPKLKLGTVRVADETNMIEEADGDQEASGRNT